MEHDENVEEVDEAKKGLRERFNDWNAKRKVKLAAGWKNFKLFVWNGETSEFCGRTFKSWGIILSYYIIFFLGLSGYFSACVAIFLKTLDAKVPALQGYDTMLKLNPGMSYTPRTPNDQMTITFNMNDNGTYNDYVSILKQEIQNLEDLAKKNTTLDCNKDNKTATFNEACKFDVSTMGEEYKKNSFGYSVGKPSVFLRINNIIGWKPMDETPFEASCVETTSESKGCEFFKVDKYHKTEVDPNYIPVSCEGETDSDKPNLLNATFFPKQGFPMKYFPYYHQTDYVPPVVAVQLIVKPGTSVAVSCKIWTNKIKHDIDDQQGSVHIEIVANGSPSNSSSDSSIPSTVTFTTTPVTSAVHTTDDSKSVSHTNLPKNSEATSIFSSIPSTPSATTKSSFTTLHSKTTSK